MSSPLQAAGAQGKPTRYAPIWSDQFFTGLWTQRSPLRDAASPFLVKKFYGGSRYESLIDGLNIEVSSRLTLVRRPGHSVYNSQTFPRINGFYEFRKFTGATESIAVIADTGASGGVIYDATGPNTQTTIFTKSNGAGNAYFQSIGNILFFGDGVDQKKYIQGSAGWVVQNWGIAANSGSGNYGPDTAGMGANAGGAGTAWSNPGNVSSGVSYATVNTMLTGAPQNAINNVDSNFVGPSQSGTTAPFVGAGFGFAIPAGATIDGIITQFTHQVTDGRLHCNTNTVQMYKAGSPAGTPKTPGTAWGPFYGTESDGTSSDLWGTTWTAADINDPGFGFSVDYDFINVDGTFGHTADLQSYAITVYFHEGTSGAAYSQSLQATNFGFSVPTIVAISGVSVSFNGATTGAANLQVQLLIGGNPVGTPKTLTSLSASPVSFTLGSFSDLWGNSSIPSPAVDATNFGVQFTVSSGYGQHEINDVQITVYSSGIPTATPTGSGTFSAVTGYKYVYEYGNSLDGNTSTATLPSVSTGPFTNVAYVGVTVQASSDPQVNQIRVFRTLDGGATFFELPTSPYPNTTTTIPDSAPDSTLNIFSQAALNGYNNPPPAGFSIPAYHVGLMWGAVNNVLYYSRAIDPSVLGNNAEDFPPNNYFIFPSKVIRLVPTVFGLLVFLLNDIWVIQGTGGTNSPFIPVPYVPGVGVGLGNYYSLTLQASLIYLMVSEGQTMSIDPNSGLSEIGFPIGDLLEKNFNPNVSQVTYNPGGSSDKALFITDGSANWYRFSPVATPETSSMFSPVAQPVGGFSAVQSVEQTGGKHILLVGPGSSGPILFRDPTVVTDNGAPYPAFATIGSVVLALPGGMAELGFLAADYKGPNSGGSAPVPSVLLDDTKGTFSTLISAVNDPPTLPQATYTLGTRWYFSTATESGQPLPAWCRHLQIKMTWGTTPTFDELYSYTLFGGEWREQ